MVKKYISTIVLLSSLNLYATPNSINETDGVISWKVFVKQNKNIKILNKVLTQNSDKNAFDYLNTMRQKVGMIPLKYNTVLAKAAKNHSKYLIDNNIAPGHYESDNYPEFTGITPSDRVIQAGYFSRDVSENLSAGDENYKGSVDDLFSAIYHRFGFLDFKINEIGIGDDENDNYAYQAIFVYDMGNSLKNSLCNKDFNISSGSYYTNICANENKQIPAQIYENTESVIEQQNPKIIFWPPKDYNKTSPVFYDESPDPLPDYSVSGYPISIQFNPYYYNSKNIQPEGFNLYDENGKLIDTIYMDKSNDPNDEFSDMEYAIFPKQRLDWDKNYYVKASFDINGSEQTFKWHFKTKALPYPYYKVVSNDDTLNIQPNKDYAVYLVPLNANDTINSLKSEYEGNDKIQIDFIDENTLHIRANGKIGDKIILNLSGNRKITLVLSNKDNAVKLNSQYESNFTKPTIVSVTYTGTPKVSQKLTFNVDYNLSEGRSIKTIEYNYGDSNTWTTSNTHIYTKAGKYTIKVKITDNKGEFSVKSTDITIAGIPFDEMTLKQQIASLTSDQNKIKSMMANINKLKSSSGNTITASDINALQSGWNLIGTITPIDNLSIFNNAKIIWVYDSNSKSWSAYSSNTETMKAINNTGINAITSIPANSGIWVFMP